MDPNQKTDAKKWNSKYASRPGTLADPDQFLSDNLKHLSPGTVLDVACGDGRNSIFLASKGFAVTGADISAVALERLAQFAHNRSLSITAKKIDLEAGEPVFSSTFGVYNNIVVINYKPTDALWKTLPAFLVKSGILVYCTFNKKHHQQHGFPERFCIEPGIYKSPPPLLDLLFFAEIGETTQPRDGYVFRKA
ncbi:MAG: methyltransferase domain-containing protein [Proteobacteria bacterium]|nr:methyltransferase domain-containing protein [Pseudomonadota bacterium]